MAFSLGIVGLPNVGKSTLFNVLSKNKANVSNYPFCTIDPNVGVVEVPDERLTIVQTFAGSAKAIPTTIEFIDIAGLVKGAHRGEGLGNRFLGAIREVDAIAHVVRCFPDPNIVHVDGRIDPVFDIEVINYELEQAGIKKPVLYVANVDETGNEGKVKEIRGMLRDGGGLVVVCAKLEEEMGELPVDEAEALAKEMGLKEWGTKKLIRSGYDLLDLVTFFTANNKECRAWTVKRGAKIPQAAGRVHTDMEKGFITAEVIHYKDLAGCHSFTKAREKGVVHTEGKDSIVQDGDLVLVKFNV